jgi:hypothetical protein
VLRKECVMSSGVPVLALLAVGISLAGCFGPKELPDWPWSIVLSRHTRRKRRRSAPTPPEGHLSAVAAFHMQIRQGADG